MSSGTIVMACVCVVLAAAFSLASPADARAFTDNRQTTTSERCAKLIAHSRWLWSVERSADALQYAAAAAKIAPDCCAAQLNYAQLLQVAGDCDRALEHYAYVLQINKASTQAILGQAQCLAVKGDSKASLAMLEILRRKSNDSDTWYQMGTVYLHIGKPTRSARCYERALLSQNITAKVAQEQIRERLLLAYIGSGESAKVQHLLAAVVRQSRSPTVYEAALQWSLDAGRADDAEKVLKSAESRFGYSPELLYRLAWLISQKSSSCNVSPPGKWDHVNLDALTEAHRLDPTNQKTLILMAALLERELGTEFALGRVAALKPDYGSSAFEQFAQDSFANIEEKTPLLLLQGTPKKHVLELLKTTARMKLTCGCHVDFLVDQWSRRPGIISVQVDHNDHTVTIISSRLFKGALQKMLGERLKHSEYVTITKVNSIHTFKELAQCSDLNPHDHQSPMILELQPLPPLQPHSTANREGRPTDNSPELLSERPIRPER